MDGQLQWPGRAATIGHCWNDPMRIVCPSCQAAYEVPEKLLGGTPRKVRCARCGTAWAPDPAPSPAAAQPEPAPEEPSPSEPELEPTPPVRPLPPPPVVPRAEQKLAPPPPEPPPGRSLVALAGFAWIASLALLAGAGWAAFAWRGEIMALWAPSRRIYVLLGLG
jgi:predicted Zn finger-like uncharacterized protein